VLFVYRSTLPVPAETVFAWHERPEALGDLAPRGGWFRIADQHGGVRDGGVVTIAIGPGPFAMHWRARHFGYVPNLQFCDEQVSGPFALWRHVHRTEPLGPSLTNYEDRVDCLLPGGRLINRLAAPVVRLVLTRMFQRRHAIVREALTQAA
jgi:uncharacterized protein